jgi:glycerol uptake facilitator-like aquaporin
VSAIASPQPSAAAASTLSLTRRLAAETLGSLLLAAVVIGSGIMAERLSGGNLAVALLANTGATMAALYVLILALGPVSGAHFNPAVTIAMTLLRRLTPRDAALYIVAQIVAMIVGAFLAHAMFELPLLQVSARLRAGEAQILAEAVATFGLLLTILLVERARPAAIPAAVACWIGAAYWFTASTSFGNPAITIARALSDSFAGIAPAHVPGFVLGQLAGALLGVAAAWLLRPADRRP